MEALSKVGRIVARCGALAFRAKPVERMCEWLSRNVIIPAETGASEPGPLDTARVPPMEGLYEMLAKPRVHFFTLMKSARVGGTLFAICFILHRIAMRGSPILWVDPSNLTARQLFRRELEPYMLACPPVAAQALNMDKRRWQPSQCFFSGGSFLKMAGSASPSQMAGFQAEIVVINEADKAKHHAKGEAPAHQLAVVRSKQFEHTRKILENSTPTDEFGPTYTRFLAGSQHHCYVPCPHCSSKRHREQRASRAPFTPPAQPEPERSAFSYDPFLAGWQRLTFFVDEKDVPFTEDGEMLPAGGTRLEKTGSMRFEHCRLFQNRETEPGKIEKVEAGWDYDRAARETYYRGACGCRIEYTDLNWMLRRYWWRPHKPGAAEDHISAHWWAAYSPFEHWGSIAKRYLLALGDVGAMHDVWNNDFGLPFKRVQTAVTENDLTRLQGVSPRFLLRTLPSGDGTAGWRPEVLTMTADVQKQTAEAPFWWGIFAWGIAWDLPEWPTVAVVVDYGPAQSWTQIEELAAIAPLEGERYNEYLWRDPKTGELVPYRVFAGLVDSGDQAQSEADVYEFCRRNNAIFSPSKGGSRNHCRGNAVYFSDVDDKRLQLWWYWSDVFAQRLYRNVIKERKRMRWLPQDLDADFFDQLTDERTEMKQGRLVWVSPKKRNHLGDMWKMQEVMGEKLEERFNVLRAERQAAIDAQAAAKADLTAAK